MNPLTGKNELQYIIIYWNQIKTWTLRQTICGLKSLRFPGVPHIPHIGAA